MWKVTWLLVIVVGVYIAVRFSTPKPPSPTEVVNASYDYIIVGAGSAGAVLASRLSEDPSNSVLILEAGDTAEGNDNISTPFVHAFLLKSRYDWIYYTEPQKEACLALKEQRSYWPRGRVLGGSSSLNWMVYERGSRHDYNSWAADGCEGWSFKDVFPYFLKSEDIQVDTLKNSDYHGNNGPLTVSGTYPTPLSDSYVKAGEQLGYKINDANGKDQIGVSYIHSTVRNGVRCGTYYAFLKPAMKRTNLHVSVNSMATKIIIRNKKAVGVEFIKDGRKSKVFAKKEVILSGGAINSPQLLMLSGIGPKQHLKDLGIDVILDLPVGQNLQDHVYTILYTTINQSLSVSDKDVASVTSVLKYLLLKKGLLATSSLEGVAFFNTDGSTHDNGKASDMQFHFQSFSWLKPHQRTFGEVNLKEEVKDRLYTASPEQHSFNLVPTLLHPKSKGTIKLQSRDPFDHPVIDPRYLTATEDVDILLKGIRIAEKLAETPAFREIGVSFDNPSPFYQFCKDHKFRSDDFWKCYLRHFSFTTYHPTATCRMGRADDPTSVVDPQLRVKGIANLRVVDASVMRNIPSGNTNAPTIMIAEKAADLIRKIDSVKKIRQNIRIQL